MMNKGAGISPSFSCIHHSSFILHHSYFILHTSSFILHTPYFIIQTPYSISPVHETRHHPPSPRPIQPFAGQGAYGPGGQTDARAAVGAAEAMPRGRRHHR